MAIFKEFSNRKLTECPAFHSPIGAMQGCCRANQVCLAYFGVFMSAALSWRLCFEQVETLQP
jgi:hypothetical protein